MKIPFIGKSESGYGLDFCIEKEQLELIKIRISEFDKEEFAKKGAEILNKHDMDSSAHPYFDWKCEEHGGILDSVYLSAGGRWIDNSTSPKEQEFHFHNVAYAPDAIAGVEILVGEYFNKLIPEFKLPFIEKRTEFYEFSFPISEETLEKMIKMNIDGDIDEKAYSNYLNMLGYGKNVKLNWQDRVLKDIYYGDKKVAQFDGQSFKAVDIDNASVAVFSFRTIAYLLNHVSS